MNIVGISAFYHDSAACLLKDGQLIAAASEERFSRIKNDPSLPVQAFTYCLLEAGLDLSDIDCIAYYESPVKKLSRQLWCGLDLDDDEVLIEYFYGEEDLFIISYHQDRGSFYQVEITDKFSNDLLYIFPNEDRINLYIFCANCRSFNILLDIVQPKGRQMFSP